MATGKKSNWVVRVKCSVLKEVVCEDCTEVQAKHSTWKYAKGPEIEVDMDEWEVLSVKEDK